MPEIYEWLPPAVILMWLVAIVIQRFLSSAPNQARRSLNGGNKRAAKPAAVDQRLVKKHGVEFEEQVIQKKKKKKKVVVEDAGFEEDRYVGIYQSVHGKEDVFEGPRGGLYNINDNGNKVYIKQEDTAHEMRKMHVEQEEGEDRFVGIHHSSGSANGKKLYEGRKGGIYYINDNGNKTYVKRK